MEGRKKNQERRKDRNKQTKETTEEKRTNMPKNNRVTCKNCE